MSRSIEAVYEHGVLRPLEPVGLTESQHVRVMISEPANAGSERDLAAVESAKREIAGIENVPTIEEVREALASIPGSMTKDVIAERGDY